MFCLSGEKVKTLLMPIILGLKLISVNQLSLGGSLTVISLNNLHKPLLSTKAIPSLKKIKIPSLDNLLVAPKTSIQKNLEALAIWVTLLT